MSPVFNIRCMKFCLIVASDSTHVSRDGADTCSKTKLPKFQIPVKIDVDILKILRIPKILKISKIPKIPKIPKTPNFTEN